MLSLLPRRLSVSALFVAVLSLVSAASIPATEPGIGQVRQVPAVNVGGTVEGSLQVMSGGAITLNGGATITCDLLVPGTPLVRINGKPNYAGTLDANGPATPSNYTVTLNGQATMRHVIRRTAPLALPTVPPPPAPAGTRNVTLNSAGQPVGAWPTLRNLTLNGNVGQVAVPPGTYGDFVVNGGSSFTLGISGATTPAVYNFQRLTLNGQARIEVVGPVTLNLAQGLAANGTFGASARPDWLALNIASGGLTLNGGSAIHAFVNAPAAGSGTVIINGNSSLTGGLVADKLIVNGGGLLRLRAGGGGTGPVNTAPVANSQSLSTPEDAGLAITLTATDAENDTLSYRLVSVPSQGALTYADGTAVAAPGAALASTTLRYAPAADFNGADSFTFRVRDAAGLESDLATVFITVMPVNDAPVAQPQAIELREDERVLLTLAATDAEGQSLAYALAALPAHGTLTLADGSPVPDAGQPLPASAGAVLRYVPSANFHGADAFAFTATDGGLLSAPAAIHLTVMPVNDAPVAVLERPSSGEDFVAPARVTMQASIADADGGNDIVRVVFRVDGQAIGEVSAAPWIFVWEAAQPGSWEIDAVVYDRAGAGGVSSRVAVTVAAPPPPSFARVELELPPSPVVEISARPTLGLVPFESEVSWRAVSAAAVAVSGPDFADQVSSGSSVRRFSSVGSYEFAVSASAPRIAHLSWSVADATSVRLIDPAGVEQDVTGSTAREVSVEGAWRLIATNAVGVSVQAERVVAWPPDARRTVTVVAKAAPRVALVAPAQDAQLPVSSPLVLEAEPTDDDGSDDIARVEFFAGDTKLGSVESAPWRFVWAEPAVGELLLRAEVEDRSGARGVSSPVSVRVLAAPAVIAAFSAEAPAVPAAEISAEPRTGSAPLITTIAWRTTNASSVEVRGAGVAADGLVGTAATTLETPGSYVYAVTAQPLRAARLTWQVSGADELFLRDPSGRQIGVAGLGEYQATAAGVWCLVARNADGVETVSEPLELAWPAVAVAQVEVTVNTPPRRPLAVDVGADRLVSLPTTVALSATVLDAGQTPPSGALAYVWSFATLGGNGTATISPADGATPTVAFSAPGLYRLTLSVETADKLAAGEDSLLVQVQPAPVIADTGASGSVGYDYWITFLRNYSPRSFYFEKVRNELIITATEEAEGTITQYVPEVGWQGVQTGQVESVIYFKVSPGRPYRFLPDAFNAKAGEPQDKVDAIFRPGVARKAAIRVRSDKPVEIHGLSAETYSADGFRAFPSNLLGKEYILAGFDDFKLFGRSGHARDLCDRRHARRHALQDQPRLQPYRQGRRSDL